MRWALVKRFVGKTQLKETNVMEQGEQQQSKQQPLIEDVSVNQDPVKESNVMEQGEQQQSKQQPLIEDLSVNQDPAADVKGGRTGASNTKGYFTDDYSLTT
jgi:hypothetical protein